MILSYMLDGVDEAKEYLEWKNDILIWKREGGNNSREARG